MTSDMNLQNTVSAPKSGKKKKASSLNARKARAGWWFVAPFVVGFILIYLPILIESITYTFCEVTPLGNGAFDTRFVGFENYLKAFADESFRYSFGYTALYAIVSLLLINVLAFAIALALTRGIVGTNVFRTIYFMPNLIGGIVLGYIWNILINCVLSLVGAPLIALNTSAQTRQCALKKISRTALQKFIDEFKNHTLRDIL